MWSSNVPAMNYPDLSSNAPGLVTLDMLRGLWMTHEIRNNPEELADLAQSRAESERGEVRWLDDNDEDDGLLL